MTVQNIYTPEKSSHRAKVSKLSAMSSCRHRKCTICCGKCMGDFHCIDVSEAENGN